MKVIVSHEKASFRVRGLAVEIDLWNKETEKTESLRRLFVKRSYFC